jgi:hypothetical protein
MKGRRNRGLGSAVPLRQPVKGADGLVIGQDYGHLPTTGDVGRLALCAGLGLHGLGPIGGAKGGELALGRLDGRRVSGAKRSAVVPRLSVAGVVGRVEVDAAKAGVGFAVHGWLRSVTVGPSYPVTSDVSSTVRREVGK